MGWWSPTIMGGDPPLDWQGLFEDLAEGGTPLTKELVDDNIDKFIGRIQMDKDDPEIGWQVLGAIILRTGAYMPDNARHEIIKNTVDNIDNWREPEKRQLCLDNFKEKITNYKDGDMTEIESKNLLDKIYTDQTAETETTKIRQHIPSCVDVNNKPLEVEFSTVEELLEIPFVKKWKSGDFYRYSIADRDRGASLMAEVKKGKEWWVIGHINDASNIDLPDWVSPSHGRKQ